MEGGGWMEEPVDEGGVCREAEGVFVVEDCFALVVELVAGLEDGGVDAVGGVVDAIYL